MANLHKGAEQSFSDMNSPILPTFLFLATSLKLATFPQIGEAIVAFFSWITFPANLMSNEQKCTCFVFDVRYCLKNVMFCATEHL